MPRSPRRALPSTPLVLLLVVSLWAGCAFPSDFDTATQSEDTVEDTSSDTDVDEDVDEDLDEDATDTTDAGDTSDATQCQVGEADCDGTCVDPATDPDHCGGCMMACGEGQKCVESACCDEAAVCQGACVDLTASVEHCGACNNACAAFEECVDSACGCPETIDLLSDPDHCGVCGNACGDDAPLCTGGTCVTERNQIAVGTDHACMIDRGNLYCWGSDAFSQLGVDPDADGGPGPVLVSAGEAAPWREVVAGHRFTCGLRSDGQPYCWGQRDQKVLGQGMSGVSTLPTLPVQFSNANEQVRLVHLTASTSPDARTVCGLTADGSAWCWGDTQTQLGLAETGLATPYQSTRRFTDLALGDAHICGVEDVDGDVLVVCDGPDAAGWNPSTLGGRPARVFAGPGYSCVSDVDTRALSCWGTNDHCELGRGGDCVTPTPGLPDDVLRSDDEPLLVLTAALGGGAPTAGATPGEDGGAACAIVETSMTTRELFCWGDVANNRVGLAPSDAVVTGATPVGTVAANPALVQVLEVAVGRTNTCVLQESGDTDNLQRSVYCVGSNGGGELGNGERSVIDRADLIHGVTLSGNPVAITASDLTTCAAVDDNGDLTIECWGSEPPTIASTVHAPFAPASINLSAFDAASAAYCEALDPTRVRCWGEGYETTPEPLTLDTTDEVVALGVGDVHSCALIDGDDGMGATKRRLECWGTTPPGSAFVDLQTRVGAPAAATGNVAAYVDVAVSDTHVCVARHELGSAGAFASDELECVDVVGNSLDTHPTLEPFVALDGTRDRVCATTTAASGALVCVDDTGLSTPLDLSAQALDLAVGPSHWCAASAGSSLAGTTVQVQCRGSNADHQLGGGASADATETEFEIADAAVGDFEVAAIAAGRAHSCALVDVYEGVDQNRMATESLVTCWGRNSHGQLGPDIATDSEVFVRVAGACVADPSTCALPCDGATPCDVLTCQGAGVCGPVSCDAPSCTTGANRVCDETTDTCQIQP